MYVPSTACTSKVMIPFFNNGGRMTKHDACLKMSHIMRKSAFGVSYQDPEIKCFLKGKGDSNPNDKYVYKKGLYKPCVRVNGLIT